MSIPGGANPLLLATAAAAAAGGAFEISRSLRFDSSSSSSLTKTFSSNGDRQKWTFSFWIKRSKLGTKQQIFGSQGTNDSDYAEMYFDTDDKLFIRFGYTSVVDAKPAAVFRDVGAWMHIVIALDTQNSTANHRLRVYVNGTELDDYSDDSRSSFTGTYGIGRGGDHKISGEPNGSGSHIDGYMAEIHYVNGSQKAPTDFAEVDSDNNWNPKAYDGSYGTNGFYLKCTDNTSSASLGTDSSGNNNTFAVNNFTHGPFEKTFTHAKPDGSAWGNIENAFNGNTSNYADGTANNHTTSKIFFNPPLTGVTKLRIYWYGTSVYGYNDTEIGTGSTTAEYKSVYSGSAITIHNIIGVSKPGNGVVRIYAIEVNDTVLTGYTNLDPANIDSLIDTPTNADADSGNNIGNYATYNPLALHNVNDTVSEGNLKLTSSGSGFSHMGRGTIPMKSGKWYFEVTWVDTQHNFVGIVGENDTSYNNSYVYLSNAKKSNTNGSSEGSSYGASWGNNDIIGCAFDADNGTLAFYKNGVSQGTAFTGIATDGSAGTSTPYPHGYVAFTGNWNYNNCTSHINFGQRPFAISSIPAGYKSLCTQNLTDPTIADGSTAMDVALWDGNSGTQTISGLGFSPDLVWGKCRSHGSTSHHVYDQVRTAGEALFPNATNAEVTYTNYLTGFTSDGFTLGSGSELNFSGRTFLGWAFDAGSSNATNNNGSIETTVRANQSAGFSIVTGTGSSSAAKTCGHGLNAEPHFIIVKLRVNAGNGYAQDWQVYHKSLGNTKGLQLNLTNSVETTSSLWNNTSPTNSVFSIGASSRYDGNFVAYCFSPVSQYSSFGVYTGNGSINGPFIHTGFRPALLAIKRTDNTGAWKVLDTSRSPFNVASEGIDWNTTGSEFDNSENNLDILSNGFKLKTSHGARNASGGTFIYMAWAEHPLKTSRAR